jgi:alpha-N-arabinofuranosidase
MKKIFAVFVCFTINSMFVMGQNSHVPMQIQLDKSTDTISKHIYGHFAEHLGRCIYDGFYVGDSSTIANTDGVRNDIISALKELHIPNLRWPGGCFADMYHWRDGIGPKNKRPQTENVSWGNVRENNGFGTHEFLDMCERLGAEPYLAVNMNSGTVREAVEWEQYVNNANGSSSLTDLRKANGRDEPWNVKYWGIGNESWDCGGNMTADYYVNLYKRYARAMTSYSNDEGLYRIAVGPGWDDYDWTETIMKNIPLKTLEGLSIHHYSVMDWNAKSHSTEFTEGEYFKTMERAWFMEEFISKNSDIMDKYDPEKKVGLVVDEWGGWYEVLPGTNPSFLYQQNTMRDAMIAGLTLNIFNNHADRVHMANLAQTVNVLQAVILTKGEQLILTPTYHVMEMYKVHQDALLVPVELESPHFEMEGSKIPALSASVSIDKEGATHLSLVNIDISKSHTVEIDLSKLSIKTMRGRILQSAKIQDHNTFETPDKVKPENFNDFTYKNKKLSVELPPFSVVVLKGI